MNKELAIYNLIKEITSKDYMRLSCYNFDEATRLIKQDMGGLKIVLKEWLEDE